MTSHQGQSIKNGRGAQGPLCPKYGAIPTIISGVIAFGKKSFYCTRHFFQIGRHLESASLTKLVLELVRAPSDRKLTCEFWSDSGYLRIPHYGGIRFVLHGVSDRALSLALSRSLSLALSLSLSLSLSKCGNLGGDHDNSRKIA